MNTLVTGGAGFIGSNLVKLLLEQGHSVTVLDNLTSGHRRNLDPFPQVRLIVGDVRDIHAVRGAVSGAEVVFHLAASVGNIRSIEHPIEDSEVNVIGTLNILEAARRSGVRKVVFSSSAGVFGEFKTLPIQEDHPAEPDSPYGASKLCAEKLCLVYGKLYDLDIACLRYFNVYGPHQRYDAYGNVIPIFVHNMLCGLPVTVFGDGEQTRDFVNVRDVAWANLNVSMAKGATGTFNIGSGIDVTIHRLAILVACAANVHLEVQYASPRKGDVRHSRADVSRAQRAFGFQPRVDLKSGIFEYVAWLRSEQAD